jgi:hypothetical protein
MTIGVLGMSVHASEVVRVVKMSEILLWMLLAITLALERVGHVLSLTVYLMGIRTLSSRAVVLLIPVTVSGIILGSSIDVPISITLPIPMPVVVSLAAFMLSLALKTLLRVAMVVPLLSVLVHLPHYHVVHIVLSILKLLVEFLSSLQVQAAAHTHFLDCVVLLVYDKLGLFLGLKLDKPKPFTFTCRCILNDVSSYHISEVGKVALQMIL